MRQDHRIALLAIHRVGQGHDRTLLPSPVGRIRVPRPTLPARRGPATISTPTSAAKPSTKRSANGVRAIMASVGAGNGRKSLRCRRQGKNWTNASCPGQNPRPPADAHRTPASWVALSGHPGQNRAGTAGRHRGRQGDHRWWPRWLPAARGQCAGAGVPRPPGSLPRPAAGAVAEPIPKPAGIGCSR